MPRVPQCWHTALSSSNLCLNSAKCFRGLSGYFTVLRWSVLRSALLIGTLLFAPELPSTHFSSNLWSPSKSTWSGSTSSSISCISELSSHTRSGNMLLQEMKRIFLISEVPWWKLSSVAGLHVLVHSVSWNSVDIACSKSECVHLCAYLVSVGVVGCIRAEKPRDFWAGTRGQGALSYLTCCAVPASCLLIIVNI